MEKEIEIALMYATNRTRRNCLAQKYRRIKQRRQDEFEMVGSFQKPLIHPCEDRCDLNVSNYITFDSEKAMAEQENCFPESNSNEDLSQIILELNGGTDSVPCLFSGNCDKLSGIFSNSANERNDIPVYRLTEQRLHNFTNIKTKNYCEILLKTLRDARLSKAQSNKLISLLKLALPEPNNMPSSLKELLSMNEIEDIFLKRRVCVLCASEVSYELERCNTCLSNDQTKFAMVYDVDVNRVVPVFIEKRHDLIDEYKRVLEESSWRNPQHDIPNGQLYKRLVQEW